MKSIHYLLTIFAFTLAACGKKEEAPPPSPIPFIEFKSLTKTTINEQSSAKADSVAFTITYRDGDSDLGIRGDEINKPPFEGNNSYNYLLEVLHKKNGIFQRLAVDYWDGPEVLDYQSSFTYIGNQAPHKFIRLGSPFRIEARTSYEGEMTYSATFYFVQFLYYVDASPGDTFKFRLQIVDRAFHKSNLLESPEFTLGK